MRRPAVRAALLAVALALPGTSAAQTASVFTRPWLRWRTLRTEHFELHFPAEDSLWTSDLASRLEAAHARVEGFVAPMPKRRIRLIVEDPAGSANGAAYAFLDRPTIALWPSPPDPRSNIGHSRAPAEQLAVHELAHIAHLGRPGRSRLEQIATRVMPVRAGPIDRRAPRWVTEGYATWVEGRLTGSGRPYSTLRAALLRQWALEGRLPAYRTLGSAGGYYGPAMAYMVGSAFLDWLAARRGDGSLEALWLAMTGEHTRSFAAAFHEVYGTTPEAQYARFVAETTGQAMAVRHGLEAAGGVVDGADVQALDWGTGDPALSADGARLALVLRGSPGTPSRVVVWRTDEAPPPMTRGRRHEAPEPSGAGALAQLYPVEGRAHDMPRFLPGGSGLLVIRAEPVGGGATRTDLFVWDPATGALRRVTRGAGIRSADPAPDGRTAAAVRCAGGICDLVRIDLSDGSIRLIAAGAPAVVYHRPRWSPDGGRILVSVQREGRWRPVVIDTATAASTPVGPDDGSDRYEGAWMPDGRRIVVVSDRGGISNLELIDLEDGAARPLTRVTGAAYAPEVDPRSGAVLFLSLHAGGLSLRRIEPGAAPLVPIELDRGLAPLVPATPPAVDTLARAAVPASEGYGLGPRGTRVLPFASGGADGVTLGWMVENSDPVGRLTVLARGTLPGGGPSHGVAVSGAWRGWRRPVTLDAWRVSMQADRYQGAALRTEAAGRTHGVRHVLGLGASAGERTDGARDGARWLAWGHGSLDGARGWSALRVNGAVEVDATAGRTFGVDWTRGGIGARLGASRGPLDLRAEVSHAVVSAGAPEIERLAAGGAADPLLEGGVVAERTVMPALPMGRLTGPALTTWRLSAGAAGVRPYLWEGVVPGARVAVAGVDWRFALPPSNVLGLPAMEFSAGAGVPLDRASHPARVYFGVRYRL